MGNVWALTLTGPIRPSKDSALLNLAEGLEQPPDIVFALLLAEHPHKQLPVFWIGGETGGRGGEGGGGRWAEEGREKKEMLQLMAPFCRSVGNLCNTTHHHHQPHFFLSAVCRVDVAAAAVVTVVRCSNNIPRYEGDTFLYPVS